MATETLHFESARFAQQLFSNDPHNLAAIETTLRVKAVARDGFIKLDGAEPDVALARQLFQALESSIKGGATLRTREFQQALAIISKEGVDALNDLYRERIAVSSRKAAVSPKTLGQKKYIETIRQFDVSFGIGPAGTGKTYLAMAMAVSALKEEKVSRIILTRPAVEAGEALGFLPGDLYEKIDPYLRPLLDALLLDEAQNSTAEQMLMFLTRLGYGSKAVITGDPTQTDLPSQKRSGLHEAIQALRRTEGIGIVEFTRRDVVRHPLVQRIIESYEEHRRSRT
ncbi:MAG: PhoH family protein [Verrucomicrobia bacterium]|nr:PhoH family protein [Verrucomicrobiota bacterium]